MHVLEPNSDIVHAATSTALFNFVKACCERKHLTDAAGREHILLSGKNRTVQIACTGRTLLGDPVRLQFTIDGVDQIRPMAAVLLQLTQLYRSYMPKDTSADWSGPTARLRDLVIGFDVHQSGGSYRDVARAVFGDAIVRQRFDLDDRTLKNQSVRLVKRAEDLVAGGYRQLLE